jgi:hypothetical protein
MTMRGATNSGGASGSNRALLGIGALLLLAGCHSGTAGANGATGLPGPEGQVGAPGAPGDPGADAILPAGIWVDELNASQLSLTRDGLFLTNRGGTVANTPVGAFDDDNAAGVGGCSTSPNTRRGNRLFVGFNGYDKLVANGSGDSLTSVVLRARLNRGVATGFALHVLLDCDGDGAIDEVAFADSTTGVPGLPLVVGAAASDITFDTSAAIWKGLSGSAKCGLNLTAGAAKALTAIPSGALVVNARPVGASSTAVCDYPKSAVMAGILVVHGLAADAAFRESVVEQATVNYSKAGQAQSDLFPFKR